MSTTSQMVATHDSDELGQLQQLTETVLGVARTGACTYDPAAQLTPVTRNGTPVVAHTCDANGNRLTETTRREYGHL